MRNYHPTKEQLEKINRLKPINQPDYDVTELMVIPFIASNNLIHQSMAAWTPKALMEMAKSYQHRGADLMLDHAWESSEEVFGTIFDAELFHVPSPSPDFADYLLAASPNPNADSEILIKDGYYYLLLYGCVEASHGINSEIRYRRKSDVSVGGLLLAKNCTALYVPRNMGNGFFSDKRCPHYVPYNPTHASDAKFAPYAIRSGISGMIELSMVVSGNCPRAMVADEKVGKFLYIGDSEEEEEGDEED